MTISVNKTNKLNKADNKKLTEVRALINKKNYQQALWLLNDLLNSIPEYPEVLYLLGICLLNQEKYLEAATYLKMAIEISPNESEFHSTLGLAYARMGSQNLALESYQDALKSNEKNITALTEIGGIYYNLGDYNMANSYYLKIIDIKPSSYTIYMNLALSFNNLDKHEQALEYAEKGIRINSRDSFAMGIAGRLYLVGGNVDKAIKYYKKAIDLNPTNGVAYNDFVSAKKIADKNNPIINSMNKILKTSLASKDRMLIHFALGKAYNDSKEWDSAFVNFKKANTLVPTSYNHKNDSNFVKDIKKTFTPSRFEQYKNTGNQSISPIFIVGMPRSGSTLIDQVLSSHSLVYSVGESKALAEVITTMITSSGINKTYPFLVKHLTADLINASSSQYLELTEISSGSASRIVNKLLFNFFYLGLIAILFPKAKIIHCIRSPLDTCLSCYFTGFELQVSEKEWTSSFENIGFFYTQYRIMMEYWKKVLPIPILDVQYESMVGDFEGNARKIIEFCDLKWEPQCLEFYKSKRSVQTASFSQVRQPIYNSSVSRWLPYAKYLGPLVEQLGDIVKGDYGQLRELGCEFKVKKTGFFKRLF